MTTGKVVLIVVLTNLAMGVVFGLIGAAVGIGKAPSA